MTDPEVLTSTPTTTTPIDDLTPWEPWGFNESFNHNDGMYREGVAWWDAPLPRRWHRCRPWSRRGSISRCACGGFRYDNTPWISKNERRRAHA